MHAVLLHYEGLLSLWGEQAPFTKGSCKELLREKWVFLCSQSHGNAYYVDYCKEVRPSVLGISYQEGRIKKAEVFQIQMSHTYCLTTKARLTDHYFLRGAGGGCAVSKKNSAQQNLLEKQSSAERHAQKTHASALHSRRWCVQILVKLMPTKKEHYLKVQKTSCYSHAKTVKPSGPGWSSCWGHCVVFLGTKLNSQCLSPPRGTNGQINQINIWLQLSSLIASLVWKPARFEF